ncbi:hypothetical protein HanXRQr2_Chr03g0123421 [Helianthus annuus]|uniref:Uncharacterized protein n=1 Tax=Helianthus annuus TaxID=4232 RepID=A0A251V8W8_HELAN|nr:hypothetical protein HanXRQr2_Chr03g0123421 [Helianthus annuus]
METSLRYIGDSSALKINKTTTSNNEKGPQTVRYASDASGSALKIYVKQKFHINSNTHLQLKRSKIIWIMKDVGGASLATIKI